MFGTEGIELWWLIPLILIGLCLFWMRGCCFGRRPRSETNDAGHREEGKNNHSGKERRGGMTTENAGQMNEREEKCAAMGCWSPQIFAEMMVNCGDAMKRQCDAMMQERMNGKWR